MIFEVKDWALDQIVEANPHTFRLKFSAKLETRANPLQQASGYMYDLMDVLKDDGQLISKDPAHLGKAIIPMSCGVVFTNINKHEYNEQGFDQVLPINKAFVPVQTQWQTDGPPQTALISLGASGGWIVDHKSDETDDRHERFLRYWPQLDCYAKALVEGMGYRVVGVAIHWVGYGEISCLPK